MTYWVLTAERMPDEMQAVWCTGHAYGDELMPRFIMPARFYRGEFRPYFDPAMMLGNEEEEAYWWPTHWGVMDAPGSIQ
jgi:hypothetical protein